MLETGGIRTEDRVGEQHSGGRPFHFTAPNQDNRIRKVFGTALESPLPGVTDDTLAAYRDYLLERLTMPFEALYCRNDGEMRQLIHYVKITGLTAPQPGRNHFHQGLLCTAENHREVFETPLSEIGVREESPNCQLIDDYAYWFVNWR